MSTMKISRPETLKTYVDEQVACRRFGTSSEYMRDLIRRDRNRQRLRGLLLEGADSDPGAPAETAYFDQLRERTRKGEDA